MAATFQQLFTSRKLVTLLCVLFLLPSLVFGECTCDTENEESDKDQALRYKLAAIASILVAGAIGVSIPILGKFIPALRPETDIFFVIKAFAAGVILATGFIHVLPDGFETLKSPCLSENPWGKFPFTGFVAMVSAIGTLMVDSFATSYCSHRSNVQRGTGDEDQKVGVHDEGHEDHIDVHSHATHGHTHGSVALVQNAKSSELLRHRVISQAKFKSRAIAIMAAFYSLTTPVGIAIGIAISNGYDENSSTALIVEGIFNAASAGILIYMALVDLLAADFMSPRMQSRLSLQIIVNISLLLGAGCMSLLAKWA